MIERRLIRIENYLQSLNDRWNHLLFSLTGSRAPFMAPGGDIAYQFRHDVATHETLYIRTGYQRIAWSTFTINGIVILDGDLVIL